MKIVIWAAISLVFFGAERTLADDKPAASASLIADICLSGSFEIALEKAKSLNWDSAAADDIEDWRAYNVSDALNDAPVDAENRIEDLVKLAVFRRNKTAHDGQLAIMDYPKYWSCDYHTGSENGLSQELSARLGDPPVDKILKSGITRQWMSQQYTVKFAKFVNQFGDTTVLSITRP